MDQIVQGRADGKELKQVIHEVLNQEITTDGIGKVFDALPKAVAIWLKQSGTDGDVVFHGTMKGGLHFTLSHKLPSEGHGVAAGHAIEEHFALHISATEGFMKEMEADLGLPVKKG